MTMRELEIQFQNAMNELQASFEKQHREWQQRYHALQQQLLEAQQREAALHAQNEQLARKLSTASSVPEQHALVKQIKMLGAHLDALAKDAATFNHRVHNQPPRAADNFSGEQH
ncbi:MbeD family mobilization/exclusion protein [Serratia sp. AKBS12]|uniref:MbeD family mobilization/exclusion protein n=1 Tax=Serratia sp. AKBS12 TaxID=2974597 RepID=UPI002165F955|nr:MbeD family mobilization/exclusion protein [Serratia sp. AKBS12]MCS3407457.1 MbeD family mobilization/exclusion protein [Serratia sp. AKBS12]HEI8867686.1 MbeD/MobD like protein [Serratia odorifera]